MGARSGLDALEKRNIPCYCWESNKDTSVVKPVVDTPLVYVNDKHSTTANSAVVTDTVNNFSSNYTRSEILKIMLQKI
jgi:hypothetical protein